MMGMEYRLKVSKQCNNYNFCEMLACRAGHEKTTEDVKRETEFVVGLGGSRLGPRDFDEAFGDIPGIDFYQVIYEKKGNVMTVNLVKNSKLTEDSIGILERRLRSMMNERMGIKLRFVGSDMCG